MAYVCQQIDTQPFPKKSQNLFNSKQDIFGDFPTLCLTVVSRVNTPCL